MSKEKIDKKIPPTIDSVIEYGSEIDLPKDDCEAFHDHHQARGWVFKNKQRMVDWRAALRTWKRQQKRFGQPLSTVDKIERFKSPAELARIRRGQPSMNGERLLL